MNFSRFATFSKRNVSSSAWKRLQQSTSWPLVKSTSRYKWNCSKNKEKVPAQRIGTANRVWTAKNAMKQSKEKESMAKKEKSSSEISKNRVWTARSQQKAISTQEKEPKPLNRVWTKEPRAKTPLRRISTEYKTKYALKRKKATSQKPIVSSSKTISRYKFVANTKIPKSSFPDKKRLSGNFLRKTRHKIVRVRTTRSIGSTRFPPSKKYKLIRKNLWEGTPGGKPNAAANNPSESNLVRKVGRYKLIKMKRTSAGYEGEELRGRYKLIRAASWAGSKKLNRVSVKTRFKLVKKNLETNLRHAAAGRVLRRSLTLVRASRLKHNSRIIAKRYCMFFNRFGKCKRGNQCPYIHDSDKIAVCTRFLRGTCDKTDGSCLFSHKLNRDKMPVCSFFLRGSCKNDNCPYSHVRVSQTASICDDFLRGFCPAGSKCPKKHVLECPTFAATGQCPNGKKCKLVHRRKRRRTDGDDNSSSPPKRRRKSSSVKTPAAFKKRKNRTVDFFTFPSLKGLSLYGARCFRICCSFPASQMPCRDSGLPMTTDDGILSACGRMRSTHPQFFPPGSCASSIKPNFL